MAGPYNFISQWKSARNLVLSLNKQLAWNTPLADAALTQRMRFDGSAIVELAQTRRSDLAYAGKGTAFATNGQVTMWDAKLSNLKGEGSSWLLGWLFAFLMGTDTVVGAGPYTHTFDFDETTRTAVPTTVYVEDTEAIKFKCPDMCVNDLTITINDMGAIGVETNLVGTGRQVMGAMVAGPPALAADAYVLASDVVPTIGPVGAGAAITGRMMSATLKFENQLTPHRAMGSGTYATFVRKGNPKFSFTATIAAKDTDDVDTLFQNDTASVLSLAANSGATAQFTATYPAVHLKSTKIGFDGDMVVWQIEGDESTCFDAAGTPPVTVSVVNSVAAYLVGA
jgi:hypothetical protein